MRSASAPRCSVSRSLTSAAFGADPAAPAIAVSNACMGFASDMFPSPVCCINASTLYLPAIGAAGERSAAAVEGGGDERPLVVRQRGLERQRRGPARVGHL